MANDEDGESRPSDYDTSSSRAEDRDTAQQGEHRRRPQSSHRDVLEVIRNDQSDNKPTKAKPGGHSAGRQIIRLARRQFRRRFLLARLAGYVPIGGAGPRDRRLHSVVGGAMVLASCLFGLAGYILAAQRTSAGGWAPVVAVAAAVAALMLFAFTAYCVAVPIRGLSGRFVVRVGVVTLFLLLANGLVAWEAAALDSAAAIAATSKPDLMAARSRLQSAEVDRYEQERRTVHLQSWRATDEPELGDKRQSIVRAIEDQQQATAQMKLEKAGRGNCAPGLSGRSSCYNLAQERYREAEARHQAAQLECTSFTAASLERQRAAVAAARREAADYRSDLSARPNLSELIAVVKIVERPRDGRPPVEPAPADGNRPPPEGFSMSCDLKTAAISPLLESAASASANPELASLITSSSELDRQMAADMHRERQMLAWILFFLGMMPLIGKLALAVSQPALRQTKDDHDRLVSMDVLVNKRADDGLLQKFRSEQDRTRQMDDELGRTRRVEAGRRLDESELPAWWQLPWLRRQATARRNEEHRFQMQLLSGVPRQFPGTRFPDEFSSGKVKSRWQLLEPFVRSNFAELWLAQDTRPVPPWRALPSKLVVVKFVRSIPTENSVRWEQEIRAVQDLPHSDHIAPILDYLTVRFPFRMGLEQDSVHVIVQPYYPLRDLRTYLGDRGRTNPNLRFVLTVGQQLLAGLDMAHTRAQRLHLDIKPENIVVEEQTSGRGQAGLSVSLIDWGLAARSSDSRPQHTRRGLGTPTFSSPEQFDRSLSDKRSEASDLYAVGAVMFWLMTGFAPLERGYLRFIRETGDEDWSAYLGQGPAPDRLSDLWSDAPSSLCGLLDRWCAMKPVDRIVLPNGAAPEETVRLAAAELARVRDQIEDLTIRVPARADRSDSDGPRDTTATLVGGETGGTAVNR